MLLRHGERPRTTQSRNKGERRAPRGTQSRYPSTRTAVPVDRRREKRLRRASPRQPSLVYAEVRPCRPSPGPDRLPSTVRPRRDRRCDRLAEGFQTPPSAKPCDRRFRFPSLSARARALAPAVCTRLALRIFSHRRRRSRGDRAPTVDRTAEARPPLRSPRRGLSDAPIGRALRPTVPVWLARARACLDLEKFSKSETASQTTLTRRSVPVDRRREERLRRGRPFRRRLPVSGSSVSTWKIFPSPKRPAKPPLQGRPSLQTLTPAIASPRAFRRTHRPSPATDGSGLARARAPVST